MLFVNKHYSWWRIFSPKSGLCREKKKKRKKKTVEGSLEDPHRSMAAAPA